jgi:hypothetical protein
MDDGLLTIGKMITNTITTTGSWASINTFNTNFSQKSYASNVYYYTPQLYTWYSPFYADTTQTNSVIFVNASSKIITYSYELIENCAQYALTSNEDLTLRVNFYTNQNISSYTLEQCFFSDDVNVAMTKQTGIPFESLTLNTVQKGSITTLSKCLNKLLKISISNTNSLNLKILTTSQNIVNPVQVSNGAYKYSGVGTMIIDENNIMTETTKNEEVIANSLSSLTVKNGITYTSFTILPEASPDEWNISCDISTFLLSGSLSSVFYNTITRNTYTRFTDSTDYREVNTSYE